MKQGRISQAALKVALSLVTLSVKDDWALRLPPGMVDMIERLLMASTPSASDSRHNIPMCGSSRSTIPPAPHPEAG
ncbi:hypothetical protein [Pseudohongiella acticola]|uniref:hypothetical protein n=1 Tax=Pseudohongiella acticola TaxID=1524254 RepID=UPI00111309A2|nr:hypothetical protein [Pseudohongiella acticola]